MFRPACLVLLLACGPAFGQTLGSDFQSAYTITTLGAVPGVPNLYGGLTLKSGDPNTLLIGGNANVADGKVYAVTVTRGAGGHITGFGGTAAATVSAPNLDGGLAYSPTGGVLFATTFEEAPKLLQYKPGTVAGGPDKATNLGTLGLGQGERTGSVQFVPAGFAGAGEARVVSTTNSKVYAATLTPDGTGTFAVSNLALKSTLIDPVDGIDVGAEAMSWVRPNSRAFTKPTVLVNEFGYDRISGYDWKADGTIDVASRYDFLTDVGGPQGSFVDELTGDLLISTYGTNGTLLRVSGFTPVPEPAGVLAAAGIMLLTVGGGARRCWTSGKRSCGRSSTPRTTTRRG